MLNFGSNFQNPLHISSYLKLHQSTKLSLINLLPILSEALTFFLFTSLDFISMCNNKTTQHMLYGQHTFLN